MSETINKQLSKNFHIREFKCKDGTEVPEQYYCNVLQLAQNLQIIRDLFTAELKKDCPLHINSGYRTPTYNAKLEGSAVQSKHLVAQAADITCIYFSPKQVADRIEKYIAEGKVKQGGLGRYKGFTHYDVRNGKARWGSN
jgi:uncharacterized protein YcbK (DUF882 family)